MEFTELEVVVRRREYIQVVGGHARHVARLLECSLDEYSAFYSGASDKYVAATKRKLTDFTEKLSKGS